MDATFKLTDRFIERYRNRPVQWGFQGLGELVYTRTYSRVKADGTNEVWWETCQRVVEGCYRMQERHIKAHNLGWDARRAQSSAQEMYDRMFTFKFLPPGRGLWAMGTELTENRGMYAALNNCFSGETKLLTREHGAVSFQEVVGQVVTVLNGNREWRPALVEAFGVQPLQEVVLKPKGLRTNHRLHYMVTPDHTWVLADGERTCELMEGDCVRSQVLTDIESMEMGNAGFRHGLVFGDGTRHTYYPDRFMIRLCGEKARHREVLEGHPGYVSTTEVEGDPFLTLRSSVDLKQLPVGRPTGYTAGFILGWIMTDGHRKPSGSWCLDTQDAKAAEWLIEHAPQAGYTVTGHTTEARATNYGARSAPLHRVILASGDQEFTVEMILPSNRFETVYCVQEPDTRAFTLAGGILTGNCGYVSTAQIAEEGSKPFAFLMDASMLGIGVGFDVKGADKLEVRLPAGVPYQHRISDDREGWVESVALLIDCFFFGRPQPMFNYSDIRKAGEPINGFGGVASGPEPLKQLHQRIRDILSVNAGGCITQTTIVDLMNVIGCCVVAGNVRRTAEIVFGEPDSEEYLNLKNHWWNDRQEAVVHPELGTVDYRGGWDGPAADRAEWSWTSNNSVFCRPGMDYGRVAAQTAVNGEPGYAWLENMQAYGRMCDGETWKDHRVAGGNPCLEQSLEPYELCCLVETYPNNHDNLVDYLKTLKYAYLYAKTVTLGATHWPDTNRVMLRNRRIGTSMSGIQQFVAAHGIDRLKTWCEQGYDAVQRYDRTYSDWFAVPVSIKTTSVKPSGTVSLLAGATPGMHWPESLTYIRRMRIAKNSDLVETLRRAGYTVVPCVGQEDSTLVVEFPVRIDDCGGKLRTVSQVSMWEQVGMAAFLQTYWADNQVSCTVTFNPESEGPQIEHALNYFQYSLKGISFLPKCEVGKFPQMPYQSITEDEYRAMTENLQPLDLGRLQGEDSTGDRFCSNDSCALV